MLRAALVALVLTTLVGSATAEREGMATAKMAVGAGGREADPAIEPDLVTGLGLQVSWEAPAPAYPDKPGYATRFELVPEVQVMRLTFDRGGLGDEVQTTNAITGGLRLQLAIAQREQGLFKLSMRGSFFVGARVGFVADADRTRITGATVGERVWLGDRYQVGVELDALRFDPPADVNFARAGRALWATPGVEYTAVSALITFGGFL